MVAHEQRFTRLKFFLKARLNPLVILLSVLAIISFATAEAPSDAVSGVLMILMVVLGVSLRFVQEARADAAAAALKAMIRVTATVIREGKAREIPLAQLAPGDIIKLAAGDMIPADVADRTLAGVCTLAYPLLAPAAANTPGVCRTYAGGEDVAGSQAVDLKVYYAVQPGDGAVFWTREPGACSPVESCGRIRIPSRRTLLLPGCAAVQ